MRIGTIREYERTAKLATHRAAQHASWTTENWPLCQRSPASRRTGANTSWMSVTGRKRGLRLDDQPVAVGDAVPGYGSEYVGDIGLWLLRLQCSR